MVERSLSMESLDAGPSVRITQPKNLTKGSMTSKKIRAQMPSYKEAFIRASSMEVTHSLAPVIAKHTTHNKKPAVIFNASDYYGVMTDECKLTLVGKFTIGRPIIETIRSKLLEQTPLKGKVRIELKFYLFKWDYLKQILVAVGTPLKEDLATIGKSRPNLAKANVEVDLMKPFLDFIWVGLEGDGAGRKGYDKKIRYEDVPAFCRTCKIQGHNQARYKVEARRKVKQDAEKDEKQKALQSNKEEGIMQDQEINQEDKDGYTKVKNKKKIKTTTKQPHVKLTGNIRKRKGRNKNKDHIRTSTEHENINTKTKDGEHGKVEARRKEKQNAEKQEKKKDLQGNNIRGKKDDSAGSGN
ncbi:hypothetical protein FXO38_17423 [Capsicum annuum]|uniref:DUF4283 domain-containing protein n=1 Tax=Capsicum annuum TaxID=4072 RepID=A0A2G2Y8T7_CAPAN|nr:hypothetical protein FXO38_17423 [Capsicum annuum]KAF3654846.1 hypothetical protein FXO37_16269 [Capsicum annuum]PHT66152.1 hypothetical protein T459_30577 [Capsicum annuum]